MYYLRQKMGWATFSQIHLVTLAEYVHRLKNRVPAVGDAVSQIKVSATADLAFNVHFLFPFVENDPEHLSWAS
jgi:hypothetical protein